MIVKNRVTGTRITVWDILHYLEAGWSCPDIATTLHLSDEQVETAVRYIETHRNEVMAVHHQIEARKAQGNLPDIRAKLTESSARLQNWLKHHHQTHP